jgi:Na+/H+-dicarboxylate symporter
MIAKIGALLGRSTDNVDVEFSIDARHASQVKGNAEFAIFALIPTNIFASLSSNDSIRVLVFAAIFGIGMVMTERQSGQSIFDALRHIQAVCALIFDWFSLLVPIGIIALVAPQISLLGPDAFTALTLFAYPFLVTGALLLLAGPLLCAHALRASLASVSGALLKPVMLAASTRNSLICVPLALETLKHDLNVKSEPCDLYVPIGIATVRFGTILYFVIATLFMGILMGRHFNLIDLVSLAIFSVGASFATIGLSGLAALAPLAIVLRPFGLSYEVAVPLMIIVDPVADMVRTMLNVALNCTVPTLAARRAAR